MAKVPTRKPKKKVCVFCKEKISYVDYKDTNLLRKRKVPVSAGRFVWFLPVASG